MKEVSPPSRRNLVVISLHIIWATWKRQPLLTPTRERCAYRCITAEAQKLGATVLALNGMPDHVHLVVLLPSSLSLAKLMNQIKGVSSHVLNQETSTLGHFRWGNGYAAFSMSPHHRNRAIAYVQEQKAHHADLSLKHDWEIVPEDETPQT